MSMRLSFFLGTVNLLGSFIAFKYMTHLYESHRVQYSEVVKTTPNETRVQGY